MGNKVSLALKLTAGAVLIIGLLYGADAGLVKYYITPSIGLPNALAMSLLIWGKYFIYGLLLFAFGEVIKLLAVANDTNETLSRRLFQIEGYLNEQRLERYNQPPNTPHL